MPEYGVTPEGFVKKRLDVLMEETHSSLSERWGFNTRLNPQSYLNVLLANFNEKIAELWELGEATYFSMYPAFAEDTSLDHAAQFGGSIRESAAKTYYPIHCTGVDETILAAGTVIASRTNPAVSLTLLSEGKISRERFNKARIRITALQTGAVYSAALGGGLYSYTCKPNDDEAAVLAGLAAAVSNRDFIASVEKEGVLLVEAVDLQSSNTLILTENLTTVSVTTVLRFATEEYGEIRLPDGVITEIVRAVPGFQSCINLCGSIAGRLRETDAEFRRSYAAKIFNRSSRMTDSVKSAVLSHVQGIRAIEVYENDTNETDSEGRWPHCVEAVVEGGSATEIAEQILLNKSAGINTFGSAEVILPGEEGEEITVRFNRPEYVYCWFRLAVTMSPAASLPPDYADLLKNILLEKVESLTAGENVVPQKYLADMYAAVPGIDFVDITLYADTVENAVLPEAFTTRSAVISPRQLAVTDKTRMEVTLLAGI